MGCLESHKPELAMTGLQFVYATITLSTRAALTVGMTPTVFVVYRQGIATLVMTPIAYFCGRKEGAVGMGVRSFFLIFVASLLGVTINQNLYFEGLYLASSSIGSAMSNLIPALTFLLAASLRLEKVEFGSLRSLAKVLGTLICVSGAVSMALLKGPKLLNMGSSTSASATPTVGENWVLGCLFLFGSSCFWSFWLILQVPMSASYPDHLSLSAWMCFLATLQSAALAFFLQPDPKAWMFSSRYELFSCFFAGVIGSGLSFFGQSWCISKRGPLFSAMFSPLNTVIVTIFACLLLHEKLYLGSLMGAVAVVGGLYAVLWGKGKDYEDEGAVVRPRDEAIIVKIVTDESVDSCRVDVKEPLLQKKLKECNW